MRIRSTNHVKDWKPDGPRCVMCGSAEKVEAHHVGGRKHIPWFTLPFCRKPHHDRITEAIRRAGVDMRFTPNKKIRLVRALMAVTILVWALLEELLEEIEREDKRK
jgi:hypothetical protein